MRRAFLHLDNRTFSLLFKALVRSHLEYASSVWSPYKKKDINSIENVQRRATRMLPQMKNLEYEERLRKLKLHTLKYRGMRGDMIETFKIITGIYDKRVIKDMFRLSKSTTTRGNTYKLENSARDLRKYSFTNIVVDLWNYSLPDTIVTSKTIHQFENRLDKLYWENHQMKFDYNIEYGPSTGRKTVKIEEDDAEELPIEDQKMLRAETA